MGQEKTLDSLLEKHEGKRGISEIASLVERCINSKSKNGSTTYK